MTDPAPKSVPAQRFAVVRAAFEADPRHFRMNKLDIAAVFSYVAELEATIKELRDEEDGAQRYADMVNAPLRPDTVQAIADRIKSGDFPVRKVKPREKP